MVIFDYEYTEDSRKNSWTLKKPVADAKNMSKFSKEGLLFFGTLLIRCVAPPRVVQSLGVRSNRIYPGASWGFGLSFWAVGWAFVFPITCAMYWITYLQYVTDGSSNEAISANVIRRIAQCSKT